jgi:hypothetical protein
VTPVRKRELVAAGLCKAGISEALAAALRWRGPYIRAINYHDVKPEDVETFVAHLDYYVNRFRICGWSDLMDLHWGRWTHAQPGLILSFDDGCRSHVDFVAPLLERRGLQGWFFVPLSALGSFGENGGITDEELTNLASRHIVGCHTRSHRRLAASLGAAELDVEIDQAKSGLEHILKSGVAAFAWVGGELWSYSTEAASHVRHAGFSASFMTNSSVIRPGSSLHHLQRTNIEATYSIALVELYLSGLVDLRYLRKRRIVNRLTTREGRSLGGSQ